MEWVISLIPLAIAVVGLGVSLFHNRKNKIDRTYDIWTPPTTKRVLTARQRSDLYQDMDWWDREFRKLSGEPEPVGADGLVGSMAQLAEAIQKVMDYKAPADAEVLTKYGALSYTYNGNSQTTEAKDD